MLHIIAVNGTSDDLDEVMRKDEDYQETLAMQLEVYDMLVELNLTASLKSVINQVITVNLHTGVVFGVVAYRLGMTYGVSLMKELYECS